jgi:ferredoxin
MPVIRFVREGRDVECYPGENLREVALREGIALYGLKGQLGNCGGCGQCITCFVDVVGESSPGSLSGRTAVEDQKLRRRPQTWRLACQALVNQSVVVLTKPQTGLADLDQKVSQAKAQPLPVGPTAWPVQESEGDDDAADPANDDQRSGQTTTSDEEP